MEQIKLDVQVRQEIGSRRLKAVRARNFVPGIVYGSQQKPTAIKVEKKTYDHIRRVHQGENVIFLLNVMEGEKKLRDYTAIVREECHDPVTDEILHIDFNRISLKDKIEVKVPVVSRGDPIGVKRDGGTLDHLVWELDIVCLPTQIPHHLEVDVSTLAIGDSVHVKDIVMPEGVVTKHDPNTIVFSVSAPMKEEIPTEPQPMVEPEVIKEKKVDPAAEKKAGEGDDKKEEKKEKK